MSIPVSELAQEAAVLMLTGMIVVFTFLTMLIGAMKLMSLVASKLPEEAAPAKTGSIAPRQTETTSAPVAAITAAVHQYRNKHKR